jgi:hypothetical protein
VTAPRKTATGVERAELHNGVDVLAEAARLWRLPCVARQITRLAAADAKRPLMPTMAQLRTGEAVCTAPPVQGTPEVRVHRSDGLGISGSAAIRWGPNKPSIVLTIGVHTSAATRELIAHELAHLLTPGEHHGVGFVAMLSDMLREGYGVDVPVGEMDRLPQRALPAWARQTKAYGWDDVAIEAMEARGL